MKMKTLLTVCLSFYGSLSNNEYIFFKSQSVTVYLVLLFQTIYIRVLLFFYLIHYISANVPVKSHPLKFPYILYETIIPRIKKGKAH